MTRISPGLVQRSLQALQKGYSHVNVYEMRDLRMALANRVSTNMTPQEVKTLATLDKLLAVKSAGDDNLILAKEYVEEAARKARKKNEELRRKYIQDGHVF